MRKPFTVVMTLALVGCGTETTAPPAGGIDDEPAPDWQNIAMTLNLWSVDGERPPITLSSVPCSPDSYFDAATRTLKRVEIQLLDTEPDASQRDRFEGAVATGRQECGPGGIGGGSRTDIEGEYLATTDSLWLYWPDVPVLGLRAGRLEAGAGDEPATLFVFAGSIGDETVEVVLGRFEPL